MVYSQYVRIVATARRHLQAAMLLYRHIPIGRRGGVHSACYRPNRGVSEGHEMVAMGHVDMFTLSS